MSVSKNSSKRECVKMKSDKREAKKANYFSSLSHVTVNKDKNLGQKNLKTQTK